jgi:selenocysteine lyase/cysteine desulfurase
MPLHPYSHSGSAPMRTFITGNDIEVAHAHGQQEIVIGPDDTVTAVAREVAAKRGVRIVQRGAASPDGVPSAPPAAPRRPPTASPSVTIPTARGPLGIAPSPASADRPAYDLDGWRRKFPILQHHVHLANCSQSPQSDFTREAAQAYLHSWDQMGMDWDQWMEEIALTKAEFARLINADPSEIAIGTSVSEITSAVASALTFQAPRNKVVVTDAEFPTVGHVWLAHQKYGARVQFVPVTNGTIEVAEYDRYVDESTLITSICDVYYYNGFKQDIDAIIPRIHARGSLVYLDAYQGIGTHPIDVKALDVDFLSSGNLKYLLGVPGVAFLYVKPQLVQHLMPAVTGWFGRQHPFAFDIHKLDYASDARRFDNGTPPVVTAYIARAGMRVINEVGPAQIQGWLDRLGQRCIEGADARGLEVVSPRDIRRKGGTTAMRVPGSSHDVELALRGKQVIGSARADVIRFAPHFFTRLEDIDYALDRLVEVLRPGAQGGVKQ